MNRTVSFAKESKHSWIISLFLHFFVISLFFVFVSYPSRPLFELNTEKIKFVVIAKESLQNETPMPITLKKEVVESENTAKPQEKDKVEQKKIFGLKQKSLTQEKSTTELKFGNTIQKEVDQIQMKENDPQHLDSDLPTPVKEFLVTEMPQVLSEFRAPYPKEAKDKGIEGNVILDILIDESGKVRSANFISGPGFGLNEAALASIKNFKFRPAKIENRTVAVKIRYSIKFVLEK